MAQQDVSHYCGSKKITYPGDCTFSCVCPPNGKCAYTVICPGGVVFSGTEMVAPPDPEPPHITLAGNIATLAKMLEKTWKRRVTAPTKLRAKKIRARTFKNKKPEQVAEALGLTLGPRRGR